jgi:NADPH:quinone reductase-like Zn-dependent oxidoreductase
VNEVVECRPTTGEERIMRACVLNQVQEPLQLVDVEEPELAAGEVLVELKAAALNRRDFWITQGKYPRIRTPVILGSDGAGVVSRIGPGLPEHWADRMGQEVTIYPGLDWGNSEVVQGDQFTVLGMPRNGTLASHVSVPADCVYAKPAHLSWVEAAALPVAGVTAWRAVFTRGRLQRGEHVLVSGVGGGVATFALLFAVAAGARVCVTSSSADKIGRAVTLGAVAGYDYNRADWHEAVIAAHGPAGLIVDSAGGPGYANLISLAAPGGRIVNYGATAGPPERVDLFKVFWRQLRLIGSTMGSPREFRAMLDFVGRHKIRPVIDQVFSLDQVNQALERLRHSGQFGKVVLELGN